MNYNFDDSRPIYIQVAEKLEKKILQGQYHPGQKLLNPKELAIELTLNPNVMKKSIIELEKTGLVYKNREDNIVVTEDLQLISDIQVEKSFLVAKEFIEKVKEFKINKEAKDKLMEKIKEALNE